MLPVKLKSEQLEIIPQKTDEITRSSLLRTIEKKKKQLDEFTAKKPTINKKPINDESLAKEPKTDKKNKHDLEYSSANKKENKQSSPNRSIIRGKLLYEHAMNTIEKQKSIKNEVLKEREEKEFRDCSFSPQITKKSSKLTGYVHILQKTKESLANLEEKRTKRKEQKIVEEIEGCTFSPYISNYKYEISPLKQRLNQIANFEFGKKKGIWQKELKINEGIKNPRVKLTKEELHDFENKEKIIEKVLSPQIPTSRKRTPNTNDLLSKRSKTSSKCKFCKEIHSNNNVKFEEKVNCFLGYYGLTESFVHQSINNLEKTKHLNKSIDRSLKKYPRYDEYLSKSFAREKKCTHKQLHKQVAQTFQVFENFKSKTHDMSILDHNLKEIAKERTSTPQKIINYRAKTDELQTIKREKDYTYSDENLIPFTKIKDLKYQKTKPFKKISTHNNQYMLELSTRESTDETARTMIKKVQPQEKYHKSELKKLDSPFNVKKRNLSVTNQSINRRNENKINDLDKSFIRNYQKLRIFSDLKQKYSNLLQKS